MRGLAGETVFSRTCDRDQDWDLKDIQHHLVRTQRMQTSKNKKFISDIARIDNDIEDLMKQVRYGCVMWLSHSGEWHRADEEDWFR